MTTTDRDSYTAGLRQLADTLDTNPDIPLPYEGNLCDLNWFLHGGRDEMAAIARAFPVTWAKRTWGEHDTHFELAGKLAGLRLAVNISRDAVCTRVVKGTEDRVVEEVVTPAVTRKVTRQVEVVEWECQPLLRPDEVARAPEAAVAADPAGVTEALTAAADEHPACGLCGTTGRPLSEAGVCWNPASCAARVAEQQQEEEARAAQAAARQINAKAGA